MVLAEDECQLDLLPWVRASWILRGQRQQVLTPGHNRRRALFGALDLESGRWICQVAHSANSLAFLHLLEALLQTYPKAPSVAVVLDNVIIHSSRSVQAWLLEHPRVQLLYSARYSPHENPVERIWGAMKRHLANSPPPTIQDRVSQAMLFFSSRTPEQMLHTAAPGKLHWLPRSFGQNFCRAA